MALSKHISFPDGLDIPILHEDRAVMAIDKPAGWLLAPESWNHTSRNLHLALRASILAGDYWARARQLKFLRFIHRLDADASGVLLCARNPGVMQAYSRLFAARSMEKTYLAVVEGRPNESEWTCHLRLAPHPQKAGRMIVDARHGKEATTDFRVVQAAKNQTLIEARPLTGRTHQIRVHLAALGYPIINDPLYHARAASTPPGPYRMALRAIHLVYTDPFRKSRVSIAASLLEFVRQFGFDVPASYPG